MNIFFLPESKLRNLIETLMGRGRLFWTRQKEKSITIEEVDEEYIGDYKIPDLRSYDTFKNFILPLRSKVAEYPDEKWEDIEETPEKTVLFGLKACDVIGIGLLDKVFLDDPDYIDPFYKKRRESLILISSDCSSVKESCFCDLLGNTPYVSSGFDINISPVSEGYLLEAGTDIGNEILKELSLSKADKKLIKERDNSREKVAKNLKKQNTKYEKPFAKDLSDIVKEGYESSEGWALGSTCVSCGACTNICPVCYCFTLFDRVDTEGKKSKRFMVWDSCQYKGFSQMAGGMNPRFPMMERFKNRYYHKFFRFHDRYSEYKCTGCGRCIDNCLGGIDMREVLANIKILETISG